ncbi:MAG TPA: stage II sporulation protein D [Clostridiales bacterium]|jgi:stage II sporulation protein D|nr:stage II sporulation protein D [Clostridiales bacterium]
MKKILYKLVAVIIAVLLLPFILTLVFSNKKSHYFLETMDFHIYYEKDGIRQKLDFDEYLIGVVAANMPAGYHIEALKAQAVISRTYALYNVSLLSEENPNKKEFTASELGLSYIDLDEMKRYWGSDNYVSYFTKLENCVHGTQNEVLIYENNLILPVFFGTGTGHTRNAKEAWGIDIPYLKTVSSKQDVTSIHYLKITEYDTGILIGILKQVYPSINISEDSFFKEISIAERDSTGYVLKVTIDDLTISGEEFAASLGLNSNHFYIEDYEGKARIICTGVGHGVGLSQYGANAMAKEGYSYSEILSHYYSGVKLTTLDK